MTSLATPVEPSAASSAAPPAPAPDGYLEHPPPPELRRLVDCFWSRESLGAPAATGVHRILPDGCVDIVVVGRRDGVAASVVGTMTRPLLVPAGAHDWMVGVRFHPGAAHTALGVAAAALTDLRVPLDDVVPHGPPLADLVADAGARADRVRQLATALGRRLAAAPPVPAAVQGAVRAITAARGNLSITALGPAHGVTRQQLARAFARCVGVPPKTFARVVRARALLAQLRAGRRAGVRVRWSELALDLGYADQAHLATELRALTGLTPSQWGRAHSGQSVPFLQDARPLGRYRSPTTDLRR